MFDNIIVAILASCPCLASSRLNAYIDVKTCVDETVDHTQEKKHFLLSADLLDPWLIPSTGPYNTSRLL